MKWTALLLVIVLALNRNGSGLQTLEPNEESTLQSLEHKEAAKAKADVASRGVGHRVRVRVKLHRESQ